MRTCQEYEALISAFLDGELSEAERREIAEHLASCPACRQYFDGLAAMHDAFGQVEEAPVPEGFSARVMARVREMPQEEKTKIIPLPSWKRWAALAACCAAAVLGLWSFQSRSGGMAGVAQTSMAGSGPAVARDAILPAGQDSVTTDDAPMALMEEAGEDLPEEVPASVENTSEAQKQYSDEDGCVLPEAKEDAAEPEADAGAAPVPMPELAMAAPTLGGEAERQSASGTTAASGVVAASGETARTWVEDELGLDWEPGRTYLLTEEEFSSLVDALTDAGEDFRLEAGEGCRLLAE